MGHDTKKSKKYKKKAKDRAKDVKKAAKKAEKLLDKTDKLIKHYKKTLQQNKKESKKQEKKRNKDISGEETESTDIGSLKKLSMEQVVLRISQTQASVKHVDGHISSSFAFVKEMKLGEATVYVELDNQNAVDVEKAKELTESLELQPSTDARMFCKRLLSLNRFVLVQPKLPCSAVKELLGSTHEKLVLVCAKGGVLRQCDLSGTFEDEEHVFLCDTNSWEVLRTYQENQDLCVPQALNAESDDFTVNTLYWNVLGKYSYALSASGVSMLQRELRIYTGIDDFPDQQYRCFGMNAKHVLAIFRARLGFELEYPKLDLPTSWKFDEVKARKLMADDRDKLSKFFAVHGTENEEGRPFAVIVGEWHSSRYAYVIESMVLEVLKNKGPRACFFEDSYLEGLPPDCWFFRPSCFGGNELIEQASELGYVVHHIDTCQVRTTEESKDGGRFDNMDRAVFDFLKENKVMTAVIIVGASHVRDSLVEKLQNLHFECCFVDVSERPKDTVNSGEVEEGTAKLSLEIPTLKFSNLNDEILGFTLCELLEAACESREMRNYASQRRKRAVWLERWVEDAITFTYEAVSSENENSKSE